MAKTVQEEFEEHSNQFQVASDTAVSVQLAQRSATFTIQRDTFTLVQQNKTHLEQQMLYNIFIYNRKCDSFFKKNMTSLLF